jgi:cytochrome bd ubiquinol oxidase subunit I
VVQFFFGHLNGKYVYAHQPTKFAAIEARWQHQQPGTEVWFAIPDESRRRNLFAIETPGVGSFIATGTWTAPVYGLSDYPETDWPPVVIPFFTFRIMVGMGLVMLAISWFGMVAQARAAGDDALVPLVRDPGFPRRLCCRAQRLVHG